MDKNKEIIMEFIEGIQDEYTNSINDTIVTVSKDYNLSVESSSAAKVAAMSYQGYREEFINYTKVTLVIGLSIGFVFGTIRVYKHFKNKRVEKD